MLDINGALKAIGYGLLVLFFAVGVVKTCGSFTDVKRPEHALKLFIRFALAKTMAVSLVTCTMHFCRTCRGHRTVTKFRR